MQHELVIVFLASIVYNIDKDKLFLKRKEGSYEIC